MKDDLVKRVVEDIWENRHEQDFYILDLIEHAVSQWSEDDMKDYLGIDPDDEVRGSVQRVNNE